MKMLLQLLYVVPILFQTITSQGVEKEADGCKYQLHENKRVNAHESWRLKNIARLEDCVQECAKHNANAGPTQLKCDAVIYTSSSKVCVKRGQLPGQSDKFDEATGTDTAIIKSCGGTKPSESKSNRGTRRRRQVASSSTGCGRQASEYSPYVTNTRIIYGRIAKPHSWPWTLRVCNEGLWTFCGGTLIPVRPGLDESDIALTAGHCLINRRDIATYPLYLHAGKHDKDVKEEGEVAIKIAEIRFFNDSLPLMDNDIAIMRLEKPFKFSKTIQPACLPSQVDFLPLNMTCVTAGWGRNNSDSSHEVSTVLKQATLEVRSDKRCGAAWGSTNYVSPKRLCGGNGFDTTCNGDSGGPLVCQETDGSWTQYGVTSFVGGGGECVDPSLPPVFVRVSHYTEWIATNIKEMSKL